MATISWEEFKKGGNITVVSPIKDEEEEKKERKLNLKSS